jgi:hypothetical protein
MQLLEISNKSRLWARRVMQIKSWTVAVQLCTLIAASSCAIAQGKKYMLYRWILRTCSEISVRSGPSSRYLNSKSFTTIT